jgi:flagellar export protein FliJ
MKPCGARSCKRHGCPGFAAGQEAAGAAGEISEFAGPSEEEELQRQARAVAQPDETEALNWTMKKFRFPLERLLNYRRSRLAGEQARLEKLLAEQAGLEQRRAALEREERMVNESLRRLPVISSEQLAAIASFRRFAASEAVRLAAEIHAAAGRVAAQRDAVLSARREVEVLEKLRERRLHDWRREVDQETERQTAELVVARWALSRESG